MTGSDDPTFDALKAKLTMYQKAGRKQTVGHLRALVQSIVVMRDARDGLNLSIGDVYRELGPGIASGTVTR